MGLGGGGDNLRWSYLMDCVDVASLVNEMAVQTMMLNADRLTKNFYSYFRPDTGQWSRIPWDLESAFGISRGLGGEPALDYAVEVSDQWTSPLYGDRNHPQDIALIRPKTSVTRSLLEQDGDASKNFRDVVLQELSSQQSNDHHNYTHERTGGNRDDDDHGDGDPLPSPIDTIPYRSPFLDQDTNLTTRPSITGFKGTYNHLYDAILSFPPTRAVYLRRLATVVNTWLVQGRLEREIQTMWNTIRDDAERDNAFWKVTEHPLTDAGVIQLLTEWIPFRIQHLTDTFAYLVGPMDRTMDTETLTVTRGGQGNRAYVEIANTSANEAIDLSGYRLVSRAGEGTWTLPSGVGVPPRGRTYLVQDVRGFLNRGSSPKGGEGNIVVSGLSNLEIRGPVRLEASGGGARWSRN